MLDTETLEQLKNADLNEIRFSIKMEDDSQKRQMIYEKIALAKEYIPDVMVEMPVIPGSLSEMINLLHDLDSLKISGINLLEFCFPFHNAPEYVKRNFKIKNPPFRILYNYWYAGGLPVSESEKLCLDLLDYALGKQLHLGVHYCSLENKHTGQVFMQNYNRNRSKLMYFSPKDYFLKTAKVFGEDIEKVQKRFKKKNITLFNINEEHGFLEFHVKDIICLKDLAIEIGLSSQIIETRNDEVYLRELKIERIYPENFNIKAI